MGYSERSNPNSVYNQRRPKKVVIECSEHIEHPERLSFWGKVRKKLGRHSV